jgi:molybdate transport system ATP-binding protein
VSGFDVELEVERREAFLLDVSFSSSDGVTVVFGPSGSGKSTLLLSILGAVRPRRGRLAVAGRDVFNSSRGIDLPIRQRRVGMVFQDALLFPHLSVLGNVVFGLDGSDRRRRAMELLERVGATALSRRHPADLSGGERQRVALARSLAANPAALLLDEPFSALDARARRSLGDLILDLQLSTRIPFMHVPHDLGEALRLGDQLLLLDAGRVVQSGSPSAVIARPASVPAARAVGTENLFSGTVLRHMPERGCTEVDLGGTVVQTALLDAREDSQVALGLRAEDILLSLEPLHQTSARNVLAGTIAELHTRGPAVDLRVTTPVSMRVVVTPASVAELDLQPGKPVHLLIKAAAFHVLL